MHLPRSLQRPPHVQLPGSQAGPHAAQGAQGQRPLLGRECLSPRGPLPGAPGGGWRRRLPPAPRCSAAAQERRGGGRWPFAAAAAAAAAGGFLRSTHVDGDSSRCVCVCVCCHPFAPSSSRPPRRISPNAISAKSTLYAACVARVGIICVRAPALSFLHCVCVCGSCTVCMCVHVVSCLCTLPCPTPPPFTLAPHP